MSETIAAAADRQRSADVDIGEVIAAGDDRQWAGGGAMSEAVAAAHAFMAIMRRDLHVYLSYRTRLVSQVLTAVFSLTLFYYVSRLVHPGRVRLALHLFRRSSSSASRW